MAKIRTLVLVGVEIRIIEVETFVGNGFSGLNVLGMSGDALRDLRERVRSVLELNGIPLPAKRIVVNLSPSDALAMCRTPLAELEFAVAAAVVLALEEENGRSGAQGGFYCGSLALSGEIKGVSNALLPLLASEEYPATPVYVGVGDAGRLAVRASFRDWLNNREHVCSVPVKEASIPSEKLEAVEGAIRAMAGAPRSLVALLAATTGAHSMLLAGDPGVGKSFALKHLPALLSPLNRKESMEQQLICGHKLGESNADGKSLPQDRPFRSPHHTSTAAALVGGASLRPGEVTLAHGGCLFLDELGEFPRASLEALREPLDEGKMRLSRASGEVIYPAQFLLCAATNPCPCGFLLSRKRACRCTASESRAYVRKFSGPLLDRFAIQLLIASPEEHLDIFAASAQHFLVKGAYHELALRHLEAQKPSLFAPAGCLELPAGIAPQLSRRGQVLLSQLAFTLHRLFPEVPVDGAFWRGVLGYRQLEGLLSEKYI